MRDQSAALLRSACPAPPTEGDLRCTRRACPPKRILFIGAEAGKQLSYRKLDLERKERKANQHAEDGLMLTVGAGARKTEAA